MWIKGPVTISSPGGHLDPDHWKFKEMELSFLIKFPSSIPPFFLSFHIYFLLSFLPQFPYSFSSWLQWPFSQALGEQSSFHLFLMAPVLLRTGQCLHLPLPPADGKEYWVSMEEHMVPAPESLRRPLMEGMKENLELCTCLFKSHKRSWPTKSTKLRDPTWRTLYLNGSAALGAKVLEVKWLVRLSPQPFLFYGWGN